MTKEAIQKFGNKSSDWLNLMLFQHSHPEHTFRTEDLHSSPQHTWKSDWLGFEKES